MNNHIERINMVKQQLRTGNVLDEKILDLFETIPREDFVPDEYRHFAYSDIKISLPHNQCMMTPLEEALILQALNLQGNEIILEVGTGTGFLTRLLSTLGKKVISVDYYADFTVNARHKLKTYGCTNVELITGDASRGWLDKAPYDVIVFTGALDELTETHLLQVLPGGKLFAIIGHDPVMKAVLYTQDHDEKWQAELVFETNVPPLIDKQKPKEFVF